MPGLVLGDGGDQDESGLGPALEDPGSDGRTDTFMAGVCRGGGVPESLFGFAGSGKGFQRRGHWRRILEGQEVPSKGEEPVGGCFSTSKEREACGTVTVCRCPRRRPGRSLQWGSCKAGRR